MPRFEGGDHAENFQMPWRLRGSLEAARENKEVLQGVAAVDIR